MGDIADSLIDGEFDYITGEYIGEGVGYPRTSERPRYYAQSASKAQKGIEKYLMKHGIADKQRQTELIYSFFGTYGQQMKKAALCTMISADFDRFKDHVTAHFQKLYQQHKENLTK